MSKRTEAIEKKVMAGERVAPGEGAVLFDMELYRLGRMAHACRLRKCPDNKVTFVMDRIINVTNICECLCDFCAFRVPPDSDKGYVLSTEEVLEKVGELAEIGGTQVLIQGGLNRDVGLEYYAGLFRAIKKGFDVYIHSLSPPEICHIAAKEGMPVAEVLSRLREAGLDSLPGGGAEVLVDRVRSEISPSKIKRDEWLSVMRTAQKAGMGTTATMMFGSVETAEERIEHLEVIRQLQDETGGFRAFIPWSFCPENTAFADIIPPGGGEYLKMLAISRIYLDNIDNIGSGWVTEGMKTAQLGLFFGANDMGGILMEEKVLKAAGVANRTSADRIKDAIRYAGFVPARRDSEYNILEEY